MKITSWNVNGIVSCRRKGLLKFLATNKPDIVCLQEVKTKCPLNIPGYLQFWNPAKRPGYAGTLTLAKKEPLSCTFGLGQESLDEEGRLISLEYKDFYILNVYVPSLNTYSAPERFDFRRTWDQALREYVAKLTKPSILCGDFNVTRSFLDSYPDNQDNSPVSPFFASEIRDSFERMLAIGLVDVFRALHPQQEGAYTWWGPKHKNRLENRGSRLDYFLVSGDLLACVQNVKFHTHIQGSDHCPISLMITPIVPKTELSDEDMAILWRTIDWPKMENELIKKQNRLAMAAYERKWSHVDKLQKDIVSSWAAKVLAVRTVININSEAGIDGVRWKTDAEKMRAALSLGPRGYHPLPYRTTRIEEKGKQRVIHVPIARDKAMMVLYAYALDPVAESTADRKSFSARKGRSALDVHAYLERDLQGQNAPEWIAVIDVESYYSSILHDFLISIIPIDKGILRKFLKAGAVDHGELYPTEQGISLGTSLSTILGNMLLDGLQSYVYDRLYPKGKVDYLGGNVLRFADDIIVTCRSKGQAEAIMEIVAEFLAQRGLRMSAKKSYIRSIYEGFNFLSRHYQRKHGVLSVTPSDEAVLRFETELKHLILDYHGTQRRLIEKINRKLTGWGAYHRITDSYMVFRHIDAIVEGLLVRKMCDKYPRWHRETVLRKFWVKSGGSYVFVLPNDPTVRVIQLAPLSIVRHKPCALKFNPYLDGEYYAWLQHRRDIQKFNGKYRRIWTRQEGKCSYCGQPMLADQEVELVEITLGSGTGVKNLAYIHRHCAFNVWADSGDVGEPVDLFDLLGGLLEEPSAEESPYLELTEYFRTCEKNVFTLTFREIEYILGMRLDWEAYFYEAFWYDDSPGQTSPMWHTENFPFHVLRQSNPDYPIAVSWLSQGFKIKALHLESERVVFRKTDKRKLGLILPKALSTKKLPENAVYECRQFFEYLIKKYGL